MVTSGGSLKCCMLMTSKKRIWLLRLGQTIYEQYPGILTCWDPVTHTLLLWSASSSVHVMAWRRSGAKPSPESMMNYFYLIKLKHIHTFSCIWVCCLQDINILFRSNVLKGNPLQDFPDNCTRLPIGTEFSNVRVQVICGSFIQHALGRHTLLNIQLNAWWRHQMETFTTLLFLCAGNSSVTLTKASDAELWCFPWSVPEQTAE